MHACMWETTVYARVGSILHFGMDPTFWIPQTKKRPTQPPLPLGVFVECCTPTQAGHMERCLQNDSITTRPRVPITYLQHWLSGWLSGWVDGWINTDKLELTILEAKRKSPDFCRISASSSSSELCFWPKHIFFHFWWMEILWHHADALRPWRQWLGKLSESF